MRRLLLLCAAAATTARDASLGMLVPTHSVGWQQLTCAALLAAKHASAGDGSVVPELGALADLDLGLLVRDTNFSHHRTITAYRELRAAGVHALVGSARSATSTTVARLAAVDKLPQVSYWSSSPGLSDKDDFPFFARTYPSDLATAQGLRGLVDHYGWQRVGIVNVDDEYGTALAREVEGELKAELPASVVVRASFPYEDETPVAASAYESALRTLSDAQVSVVIAIVFNNQLAPLVDAADALGMFDGRHQAAWVTTDSITEEGVHALPPATRALVAGMLQFSLAERDEPGAPRPSGPRRRPHQRRLRRDAAADILPHCPRDAAL